VYDLSAALELEWYEDIGLCAAGEGAKLVREGATALGGRIPVNPSGGLASFGEAVPAQAIAQVCELTWQLRGGAAGSGGARRNHRQSGAVRARIGGRRGPLRSPASLRNARKHPVRAS
jgi:acetyl-CoA acetyltransferase